MDQSDRQAVLAQQRTLVHALVNSGAADPAFDLDRLQLASRMLRAKRYRAARRAFPELFRRLGENCPREFDVYAKAMAPRHGGALADALAFARHAQRRSQIPLPWRLRLLALEIAGRCRSKTVCSGDEGA